MIDLTMERQHKQHLQDTIHCFFLFVNSGSGGNEGSKLLQQQIQMIEFILPFQQKHEQNDKYLKAHIFIYNMRKNKQVGFNRLKSQMAEINKKCYVIVCGGDGTVMWVVTEMKKHDVKIIEAPIGVIPLGTGNDFSRELGWGYQVSNLLENQFKKLKKLIKKWVNAKQQYFDLWDIQAQVFQDGKFQKVQNQKNVKLESIIINRTFCNYFSFGIDGKVGYGFDMHRTKSRIGNLAMYACIGLAKAMTKTKTLDQLLQNIEIDNTQHLRKAHSFAQTIEMSDMNSGKLNESRYSLQIKPQSKLKGTSKMSTEEKFFAKDFYNILALNINSYTGGVKDIWQNAGQGFLKNYKNQDNTEVSTSDGKIQLVTFGSSVGIAMERSFGGFSKKVAQGTGPFVFNFSRYQKPKHRTYLQIDGQFLRFTNPRKITLEHSKLVPNGKIKVLRNKKIIKQI